MVQLQINISRITKWSSAEEQASGAMVQELGQPSRVMTASALGIGSVND